MMIMVGYVCSQSPRWHFQILFFYLATESMIIIIILVHFFPPLFKGCSAAFSFFGYCYYYYYYFQVKWGIKGIWCYFSPILFNTWIYCSVLVHHCVSIWLSEKEKKTQWAQPGGSWFTGLPWEGRFNLNRYAGRDCIKSLEFMFHRDHNLNW